MRQLPPCPCLCSPGRCHGLALQLTGSSDTHSLLQWLLGYSLLFERLRKTLSQMCQSAQPHAEEQDGTSPGASHHLTRPFRTPEGACPSPTFPEIQAPDTQRDEHAE